MPKYVCINCGYVVDWKELFYKDRIECPRCGKKIFFKLPPEEKERILKAR